MPKSVDQVEAPAGEISRQSLAALHSAWADIEQDSEGRLGVALVSTGGNLLAERRGAERFAMCSMFKLPLAAMVAERAIQKEFSLDDEISYGSDDVLSYAPVTREHVEEGRMAIGRLAAASVMWSDNTAANLLLAKTGGPERLTSWLRTKGDAMTRLDRNEPTLNENAIGDPRDTSTPAAFAKLYHAILIGDAVHHDAKSMALSWAIANKTGDRRVRAGLPSSWRVGDKTGTCGGSGLSFNDTAWFRTPDGREYILAIFLDRPSVTDADAEAALADVARTVAMAINASTD